MIDRDEELVKQLKFNADFLSLLRQNGVAIDKLEPFMLLVEEHSRDKVRLGMETIKSVFEGLAALSGPHMTIKLSHAIEIVGEFIELQKGTDEELSKKPN